MTSILLSMYFTIHGLSSLGHCRVVLVMYIHLCHLYCHPLYPL
nr:MAG TPA: hypothetical protein [Caudoviricetes sp.]